MSCYKPLSAFKTAGGGVVFKESERVKTIAEIQLPCGRCIGCRMRRAGDATLRCMHEAQMHRENCVVTLTYERGRLPPNASLFHEDYVNFMKRLRERRAVKAFKEGLDRPVIRFSMCGEYGEENGRPHYHACLFGVDFRDREPLGKSGSGSPMFDSAELRDIWGNGNVSVQDLTKETAGYVQQYIMKKQLGTTEDGIEAAEAYNFVDENGKVFERAPPYTKMSLKPGIGYEWFKKYGMKDVFPNDYVVARGQKHQVPRYYDKLLKRIDAEMALDVQSKRVENAGNFLKDGTRARLDARETVHIARLSKLKRDL